jgi:hypothetical protein
MDAGLLVLHPRCQKLEEVAPTLPEVGRRCAHAARIAIHAQSGCNVSGRFVQREEEVGEPTCRSRSPPSPTTMRAGVRDQSSARRPTPARETKNRVPHGQEKRPTCRFRSSPSTPSRALMNTDFRDRSSARLPCQARETKIKSPPSTPSPTTMRADFRDQSSARRPTPARETENRVPRVLRALQR